MGRPGQSLELSNRIIGEILRMSHSDSGLSWHEFGEQVGIHGPALHMIMSGKRGVSLPIAIQILQFAGISLASFEVLLNNASRNDESPV